MKILTCVLIPALAAGAVAAESDEGAAIRAAQEFDGSAAAMQAAVGRRCGPFELELSDCEGLRGTARIHCESCASPVWVEPGSAAGEQARSVPVQVPNPCFGVPDAGKASPETLSPECRRTVSNLQKKISGLDEALADEKDALPGLPDDREDTRRGTDLTPAQRAALSRIEKLASARMDLIRGLSEIGRLGTIPAPWTQEEPGRPSGETPRPESGRLAPDHDCILRPRMACCLPIR